MLSKADSRGQLPPPQNLDMQIINVSIMWSAEQQTDHWTVMVSNNYCPSLAFQNPGSTTGFLLPTIDPLQWHNFELCNGVIRKRILTEYWHRRHIGGQGVHEFILAVMGNFLPAPAIVASSRWQLVYYVSSLFSKFKRPVMFTPGEMSC